MADWILFFFFFCQRCVQWLVPWQLHTNCQSTIDFHTLHCCQTNAYCTIVNIDELLYIAGNVGSPWKILPKISIDSILKKIRSRFIKIDMINSNDTFQILLKKLRMMLISNKPLSNLETWIGISSSLNSKDIKFYTVFQKDIPSDENRHSIFMRNILISMEKGWTDNSISIF